ncbi:MAG: hypothetical protein K0R12_543 [Gammaproteobacteria bacterium]|jgi:hypothetical protein|nr:hypothetical protein [Gammaproteobacteria bacterium]
MSQPSLFRTSPSQDYFHLFNDKAFVDGEKTVKLLKYKKEDVAAATSVPLSSVRYDEKKMPAELRERLTEWAVALNLVADFFQDEKKTIIWFSMPNPLLGGMSPRDMIRVGRFKKLLNFIQSALDENQRENVDGKTSGQKKKAQKKNV